MARLFYATLFLALSLSCQSRGDDAKGDAKSMEGTWLPAVAELGGEKFPDEARKTIVLVISDGKYSVTAGKNPDRGTVTLDPSKKPKEMDIVGTEGPNKGKTTFQKLLRNSITIDLSKAQMRPACEKFRPIYFDRRYPS